MNLFQARVAELRNVAGDLLRALHGAIKWEGDEGSGAFMSAAESITGQQRLADKDYTVPMADRFQKRAGPFILDFDGERSSIIPRRTRSHPVIAEKQSTEEIQTLCQILRNHLRRNPLERRDLIAFAHSLNLPIESIRSAGSAGREHVIISAHPARFAAERLARYLGYFSGDKRLLKHEPLAICQVCDALYLKARSDQERCGPDCFRKQWQQGKRKKDGDYFARKMRASRQRKKEDEALKLYENAVKKLRSQELVSKELIKRFGKPATPVTWLDIKAWIEAARGRREDKALKLYELGIGKKLDSKVLEKELTLRFRKPWWPDIKSWIAAAKKRRSEKLETNKGSSARKAAARSGVKSGGELSSKSIERRRNPR